MDSQTDAVIPAVVTVTNTTSGFPIAAGLDVGSGISASTPIQFEAHYGNAGEQCSRSGSINDSVDLEPGQTAALDGYFVVPNFFTPAKPNGDPALLGGTNLQVSSWTETSSDGKQFNWSTQAASGPGVQYNSGYSAYCFSLSGAQVPNDCI